jgi:hypothetical protein
MKKAAFFASAFFCLAAGSIQNARGASALAMGETRGGPLYSLVSHGKPRVFGAAFGCRSLIKAQKKAVEACRRKGGNEPKIESSFVDRGSDNFG